MPPKNSPRPKRNRSPVPTRTPSPDNADAVCYKSCTHGHPSTWTCPVCDYVRPWGKTEHLLQTIQLRHQLQVQEAALNLEKLFAERNAAAEAFRRFKFSGAKVWNGDEDDPVYKAFVLQLASIEDSISLWNHVSTHNTILLDKFRDSLYPQWKEITKEYVARVATGGIKAVPFRDPFVWPLSYEIVPTRPNSPEPSNPEKENEAA